MKEVIVIENLSFTYEGAEQPALQDISLSVTEGEWIAITGHNGSGKSTLAKLLNGLYIPSSGKVIVDGFSTNEVDNVWEVRQRVGVVFQNPENQFVATTVRDDIAFGLENLGFAPSEMEALIVESAKRVKVEQLLLKEPHHLSGGQKQRVAIAGIIAVKPKVMVFDEATSMLDPIGRREIISSIQQLHQQEKLTIISITHDLSEAILADRMIVLEEGNIVVQGKPKDIFKQHDIVRNVGLELPFLIELQEELIQRGLPLSGQSMTEEELVSELWTFVQKK
ncbi:energy-coupling factor transporter ATPase [Alkalihalobacillus sp. LMS39]|uniref:energy-coupling factor transporter ATPase n=1 Tax=Alkalihalobacillus sp. LMS39 TaxID=2924032 RepID=UPI001FB1D7B2|nr:energy-coupling factor transporter ATPase [Alkalihalobacillus sp. LMS39]UOE94280.1 energy-coupling factor transporter ATPase [Alkalihalobacillus sp. LMS39]